MCRTILKFSTEEGNGSQFEFSFDKNKEYLFIDSEILDGRTEDGARIKLDNKQIEQLVKFLFDRQ